MKNLRKLSKISIRKYWKSAIVAILFLLLDVGVGFVIPTIAKEVLDVSIPNKDSAQIMLYTALMIFVAFVGLASVILNSYFSQKVAQYGTADLRLHLFNKIQSLSFRNVDSLTKGRLITSVTNDITQVRMYYSMLYSMILRAPIMLIGGVLAATSMDANLSQVYIFTIPTLIVTVVILIKLAHPFFTKMQQRTDDINTVAIDNVNSSRVFKSFVTEEKENKKFKEVNDNYMRNAISAAKRTNMFMPTSSVILHLSTMFMLMLGATLISTGDLDASNSGTFIAFNSFSMRILISIMIMTMSMMVISRASVSADRITEILNTEVDLEDSENPITGFKLKGEIEFKDVSFRYVSGSNYVLENMNFKINAGESIGIIGSTGSGKSSLIKMIPRLYDTSIGEVLIDGIDVREYNLKELRSQVSMATQEAIIFSGDINKNILQGNKHATKEEIEKASEMACASEFIDSKDNKYEDIVLQRGTNLSGGQKQRLSLSRSLVRNPKILILDDVTSALDSKSEEKVRNNLKNMENKPTTIIISQKISSIMELDRIMVLDNYGNIDGYDTHDNLLKVSEVYKEIHESQFGGIINE